jgi:hypothetical protein
VKVVAVLVIGAVYGAIFLAFRANVRRLRAMDPAELRPAARRQLIRSAIATVGLCVLALILGSEDGVPTFGAIVLVTFVLAFSGAMLVVARRNGRL